MIVTRAIAAVRQHVRRWHQKGLSVGLVPTMGALHEGHLALIRRSKRICDRTIVSIFVNPTQFGPRDDFSSYPRNWRRDRQICANADVDCLFAPSVEAIYPEDFSTTISVGAIGNIWEGRVRPGHFDGVATVVAKLFNIVNPDTAIFGQKDYQQTVIVRCIVRELNLPVRIVVAPTVRERGGLAMSSRNAYLDSLTRRDARSMYNALLWARDEIREGRTNPTRLRRMMKAQVEASKKFGIDYIGFCDLESLADVRVANPPLVVLIAAVCLVKGPALGRRYIDNLVVRS